MSSMWYRCILQTPSRERLDLALNTGVPERYQWDFVVSRDDLDGLGGFWICRCPREEARLARKLVNCRHFRPVFLGYRWPLCTHPFDRRLYCKIYFVMFVSERERFRTQSVRAVVSK